MLVCIAVTLLAFAAGFQVLSDPVFGLSISIIEYLSTPTLHDLVGDRINRIEVGQQSTIRLSIHNSMPTEQSFVILVEVRDGNDVTTDLFWQTGVINANGNYTMETSWSPTQEGGNYQIRSFAVTDFENPQILSAVSGIEGITVLESPFSATTSFWTVSINGKEYDFEYSLDSGYVESLEADSEFVYVLLAFEGVSRAGYLSITLPAPFVYEMFPDDGTRDLEQLRESLVLFLDGLQAQDYEIVVDSKKDIVTIGLPIPARSETLEILGDRIV